jgi:hypothetical protein
LAGRGPIRMTPACLTSGKCQDGVRKESAK